MQLEALRALCDTFFPSLAIDADPHGFWRRKASDFGIDTLVAQTLETLPEAVRSGLSALIDAFGAAGIAGAPAAAREELVHTIAASSPEAAAGIAALRAIVLGYCYVWTDESGRNPNWPGVGYPGPPRVERPTAGKVIKPLAIERDMTLDADVCIVGSGAGGGVIAGELARSGLSVIVVEAGDYYTEADFDQLELKAFQTMYWRGGVAPTADGTVQMLAGATLGGGTTINWENCVRTPGWVRQEWAREHGLTELDAVGFDRHLDSVFARIGATDRCSELNGPHQRLREGAERLGYSFRRTFRNVDPRLEDAKAAGFHGFGDATGARNGTLKVYLQDAFARGARILVRTAAQRITTEKGRASGVVCTSAGADGRSHEVRIRAPHVVAACGALETPALLLRSGIGGPAAGQHFHLHLVPGVTGVYAQEQRGWWGPAQSALVDQHARADGDYGFLIESAHHSLLVGATATPWRSGEDHKRLMAEMRNYAGFIAITRDRGAGRIAIDPNGQSVPSYPIANARDIALLRRAVREMIQLHEAAGAQRIMCVARGELQEWRRGEPLGTFIERADGGEDQHGPFTAPLFSAHQMGSARMGRDPRTSVAQPTGELHDVRGVWIGDTSAFPTALGVNPMLTCMALASRTAEHIANARQ